MYALRWEINKVSILKNNFEVKAYGRSRWETQNDSLATLKAIEYVKEKTGLPYWKAVWIK